MCIYVIMYVCVYICIYIERERCGVKFGIRCVGVEMHGVEPDTETARRRYFKGTPQKFKWWIAARPTFSCETRELEGSLANNSESYSYS